MRVNCFLKLYLLLYRQRKYTDTPEGIRTGIAVCTTLHVWSRSIVPGSGESQKYRGADKYHEKQDTLCLLWLMYAGSSGFTEFYSAIPNSFQLCRIRFSFAEFVSALLKLYEF